MASPAITTGGKECVHQASDLYKDAFRDDPVFIYMLSRLTDEERYSNLYTYFRGLMTASALNGGIFEEAEDWSSCSVLIPPGKRADNPWTLLPSGILRLLWMLGIAGCRKMLVEFTGLSDAAKKKGLKGQKLYYYVFFVATTKEARGKGLSSALLRKAQERGEKEGLPVWLEATTDYSMKLYSSLGFELVEPMVLGKGKVGSDGRPKKDGEGVTCYAMVWWPPKKN